MHIVSSDAVDNPLAAASQVAERLRERLRAAIRGRDDVIDLLVIGLIADGHVLLEDYPGSGKTTLARTLGECISDDGADDDGIAPFRRIQFTPDLLPSDITGTTIFDLEGNRFVFRRGPVFAHILLADEINRTSPKVQAALLEAMAEKQVTVDDTTYPLDDLFFVVATQNPLDLAGTYPLPTPQLDRFLFKIEMKHIERDAELEVIGRYPRSSLELAREMPGVARAEVLRARSAVREQIYVAPVVRESLVDLARGLRADSRVLQGASTRSLLLMLPALQARALLEGRDYIAPDDIERLAPHVFKHRLECAAGVDDIGQIVAECSRPVLEQLARASLKRSA